MMLTSGDQQGDVARCEELGIAAYLMKPVKQSDLFDAIMLALGITGRTDGRAAASGREASQCHGPLRILLAEDSLVNQKLAVACWNCSGHQTVVVGNGREAVAALASQRFDVVLMDVQMPEMDGLEATAAIRARERRRRARSDHRHDRPRAQGRSRTVPGSGHGRVHLQADSRRAVVRRLGEAGRVIRVQAGERAGAGRIPHLRAIGIADAAAGRAADTGRVSALHLTRLRFCPGGQPLSSEPGCSESLSKHSWKKFLV